MATLQERIASLLSAQLADGHAELETLSDTSVCGFVISSEFREKDYRDRRARIREVLEQNLSPDELDQVGTLLTYTPEEWSVVATDS